jgi:hypothetical protein
MRRPAAPGRPLARLALFALLGNLLALPCLPDPAASWASTSLAGLAAAASLALALSGLRRGGRVRRLCPVLAFAAAQALGAVSLAAAGGTLTPAFAAAAALGMLRLVLQAALGFALLSGVGLAGLIGLCSRLGGLAPDSRRALAVQLWLPFHLARSLPDWLVRRSRARAGRQGPRAPFFRDLVRELGRQARILDCRLAGPEGGSQLTNASGGL